MPVKPKSLEDIEFTEWLKHALGKQLPGGEEELGELFLLHDSGVNDKKRFFIFATQNNVKLLQQHHLFADGTFKIAPFLFMQVYTIHALVECKCLSLVYCLLPRKTAVIYKKLLTVLRDLMVIGHDE